MPKESPLESNDERLVRTLESVYQQVQDAVAAGNNPERSGVLSSLQVMLEPPVRAARLLLKEQPGGVNNVAGTS